MTIHPDSLARILDPANVDSDHEYPATMVFEKGQQKDTLVNVGFRLRGNTSRYSQKKSFKISINAFEPGRGYAGLDKFDLNGEHNDPSVVRAKIAWDLFQSAGIPASRAVHTQLFINGQYRGLYINVEHIDEHFVKPRYGNNDGSLYKCLWPADLTYHGADPNLYKFTEGSRRTYELHITDGADDYTDLARFITVLHATPDNAFADSIQQVFNVNSLLRVLAVDIATGSWDNYWFLKNNFYLYHNTATGLFEYIPYDYDNTFGIWWDGILSGVDWSTRSLYAWGHPAEQRPLTRRILAVPEFRARLTFYLHRLLTMAYNESLLFPRIDSLHTFITPAAEADSFRTLDYGFTVAQFHNSYTQALGAHITSGLKPFITARRSSALAQLDATNVPPILSGLTHSPAVLNPGSPVTIRLLVEDEDLPQSVTLHATAGDSSFTISLVDDGAVGDGPSEDGVYGAVLRELPPGVTVHYYVEAVDIRGNISREPYGAPLLLRSFFTGSPAPRLLLNEFMAKNETTLLDLFGGKDDWVEVFNAEPESLALGTFFLTDNLANPAKWRFPDTTLAPGAVLLIWADEEGIQGPLHANFRLDKDGEHLGVFFDAGAGVTAVDTITFGLQSTDVSMGRLPDGGTWQFLAHASPGAPNTPTHAAEREGEARMGFRLETPYPNPFNPSTTAIFSIDRTARATVRVFDLFGRQLETLYDDIAPSGTSIEVRFNAARYASGTYLLVLTSDGRRTVERIVLLK